MQAHRRHGARVGAELRPDPAEVTPRRSQSMRVRLRQLLLLLLRRVVVVLQRRLGVGPKRVLSKSRLISHGVWG